MRDYLTPCSIGLGATGRKPTDVDGKGVALVGYRHREAKALGRVDALYPSTIGLLVNLEHEVVH